MYLTGVSNNRYIQQVKCTSNDVTNVVENHVIQNNSYPDVFIKTNKPIPEKYNIFDSEEEEMYLDFWRQLYQHNSQKSEVLFNHKTNSSKPYYSGEVLLDAIKKLKPMELKQTLFEIDELYKKMFCYAKDREINAISEYLSDNQPKTLETIYKLYEKGEDVNQCFSKIKESLKDDDVFKKYMSNIYLPEADAYERLIILKSNQPETYQYILEHPDKEIYNFCEDLFFKRKELAKTLTTEQLAIITGHSIAPTPMTEELQNKGAIIESAYVSSSDSLSESEKKY